MLTTLRLAQSRVASPGVALALARRVAPAAPKLTRAMGAPATSTVDKNVGRTSERTAELEKLAEEHNGFLFGEVPLPEGQSREWEDWEYSYTPLMTSAFLIYGIAFWFRCESFFFFFLLCPCSPPSAAAAAAAARRVSSVR